MLMSKDIEQIKDLMITNTRLVKEINDLMQELEKGAIEDLLLTYKLEVKVSRLNYCATELNMVVNNEMYMEFDDLLEDWEE